MKFILCYPCQTGQNRQKESRQPRGTIKGAAAETMITRGEPVKPVIAEARAAGRFKTVQEILDGERMNPPLKK